MNQTLNENERVVGISPYRVCSDPKIWVFDGLMSPSLLDRVDRRFVPRPTLACDAGSVATWTVDDTALSDEFISLLVRISGVDPVEDSMSRLTIGDIRRAEQACHVDRMEVGETSPCLRDESVSFLDESKQDIRNVRGGGRSIVPALSFVAYFHDYPGGITFPDTEGVDSSSSSVAAAGIAANDDGSLSIDGRRGRIIMFQNYLDDDRHRAVNPRARHFGTFDPRVAKRNFIGGVLSNENPRGSSSDASHGVAGLLYGVFGDEAVSRARYESLDQRDDVCTPQVFHHGHHNWEEEARERLLAASVCREMAAEYPTQHKEALVQLLTVFMGVGSMRESANLRPIGPEIWWHVLSMMSGGDLDCIVASMEVSDSGSDPNDEADPVGDEESRREGIKKTASVEGVAGREDEEDVDEANEYVEEQ